MKKLLIVIIIAIGFYGYLQKNPEAISLFTEESIQNNRQIENAYQNRLSDIQVAGSGVVKHTLRDDNEGSRHQRFILQLS